jgi:hypothetical protein
MWMMDKLFPFYQVENKRAAFIKSVCLSGTGHVLGKKSRCSRVTVMSTYTRVTPQVFRQHRQMFAYTHLLVTAFALGQVLAVRVTLHATRVFIHV